MANSIEPPSADETLSQPAEALQLGLKAMTADGTAIDWARIADILGSDDPAQEKLEHALDCGSAALTRRFLDGESAGLLVKERARLVDMVVLAAWDISAADTLTDTALVAVGGYGRGELHPCSDVDLLILLTDATKRRRRGTDVALPRPCSGISAWKSATARARSANATRKAARGTLRSRPTLMESRLLAGPETLFNQMQEAVAPDKIWPTRSFFEAKLKEQHARHMRFDDTAYNLEPNVKGQPGRPARHSDDRLGDHAALRHGPARRTRGAWLSDARSAAFAATGPGISVAHSVCAAHTDRPAGRPPAVRPPDRRSLSCSATRTPPTCWPSSSSCSVITAPSWI